MRLITLNAWGGRSLHPLLRFFRRYKDAIDIFCLQEMFDTESSVLWERHPDEHLRGDVFRLAAEELAGFEGIFARFEDNPHRQSLAMFVKRGIPVKDISAFVVHVPPKPQEFGSAVLSPRMMQTALIEREGGDLLIANYHGLWCGPKTDTPERLVQSRRVKAALDAHAGPAVLCGDFNLLPETESVRILALGMRDLVRESGVISTRTPLYRHYDDPAEPNFADYVFTTPGLAVRRFEVLPDIVSDHAPLYAEFV